MKIRSLILTAVTALFFTACQQDGYKINGTAEGFADGDTIIITTDIENMTPCDTIFVKNEHFTFSGPADSVQLALIVGLKQGTSVMFFTEKGTIDVTISTDPFKNHVGGTKANDGWQEITEMSNDYGQRAQAQVEILYRDSLSEEERQAAFTELQKMESEMQQKLVEQTELNIDNELGYFIIANMSTNDETFTPEKLKELIGRMPESFRKRQAIIQLEEELAKSETTAVGNTISDFTLPTPEGNDLNVMSEVNKQKITILDFWASWCGPCRQEMPFMKELYAKNHEKGLGIVGISLDDDKDAWVKAIAELGITWPQMSDLKGWQSEAGQLFHVNSIPFVVVVDENGKILAKGLRGEKLSEFINQKLN